MTSQERREAAQRALDETTSPGVRALRRTDLPQLMVGCAITFVSSLLVLLDLFDMVSDPDPKTANWWIVASLNAVALLAGLLIIWRKPKIADLAVLAMSILLVFGTLEAILRTGWLDGVDDPTPVWIPRKYKTANTAIEAPHVKRSKAHPYGFNDVIPAREKEPGTRRVVVLGDSFIWGSGVPEEARWSRQLEALLRERDPDVEVYHWGQRGWSTKDQLDFLTKAGLEFEMDLLILGWVSNDPDVDATSHLYLTWQNGRRFSPISKVFPNAWDFATAYLNRFLMQHVLEGYGYESWKDRLYEDENLERYAAVLEELAEKLEAHDLPALVVLTPNTYLQSYREKFSRVIPLLEAVGLEHVDLFPAVENEFGGTNLRHLWANPADGHPSAEVNALYAREVVQALEEPSGFLATQGLEASAASVGEDGIGEDGVGGDGV